jgi:hypothetical protein
MPQKAMPDRLKRRCSAGSHHRCFHKHPNQGSRVTLTEVRPEITKSMPF